MVDSLNQQYCSQFSIWYDISQNCTDFVAIRKGIFLTHILLFFTSFIHVFINMLEL